MKVRKIMLLSVVVVIILSTVALGQPQGYPVDIPGTDVNFFLYRYESEDPPYQEIDAIWSRLNEVILEWVAQGQDPEALTTADVTVEMTDDNEVGVFLKDTLIVIADEYHSEINHATPGQLAEIWADNLRDGIVAFVDINVLNP